MKSGFSPPDFSLSSTPCRFSSLFFKANFGLKSKLVYAFCEEAGVVKVACLC